MQCVWSRNSKLSGICLFVIARAIIINISPYENYIDKSYSLTFAFLDICHSKHFSEKRFFSSKTDIQNRLRFHGLSNMVHLQRFLKDIWATFLNYRRRMLQNASSVLYFFDFYWDNSEVSSIFVSDIWDLWRYYIIKWIL